MIGRHPHLLAISIADDALLCAEVVGRGNHMKLIRAAAMPLTGKTPFERPEELGAALATFLREQQFAARRAVFGIPARWVLSQTREIPPVSTTEAMSILRLQAEKLAVSDASDLVYDYVGEPRSDAVSRVLILGTLRSRLEQVERLASAAKLQVEAVTPTALAAAAALGVDADDAAVLMLSGAGADVVWRSGGASRLVQHVPLSMNGHGRSVQLLGAELRRSLALAGSGAGGGPGAGGERRAVVMDAVGLAPRELEELSTASRFELRRASEPLAVADPRLTPAVALGVCATGGTLPVDFKRSRLAEKPRQRFGRRSRWIAAIVILLLVVVLFEVFDLQQQRSELAALDAQLAQLAPDVAAAEASIDRTTFGRSFFENRPPTLACLSELSRAFQPLDGIWTTNLTFRDGGRAQLQGAAAEQRTVLSLLDRMKDNPNFQNVTLLDLREAVAAREREVAFSITFTFNPRNPEARR